MEILEKLKLLEQNILILEEIKNEHLLEKTSHSKRDEWELRYGLFESIQIIIDTSCKIVNHYNLGIPKNYRECLELLEKFGYLDPTLAEHCISMTGLRNLLIHEYAEIDPQKLYKFLDHLVDFRSFIFQIRNSLA